MKKLIFVLLIVAIIIVAFIGKKYYDFRKNQTQNNTATHVEYSDEDSIRYEIEMINQITANSYNQEEINEILDRITTEGDWAVVEKAIKQYMKDYINMSSSVTSAIEQINLNSILSQENLTSDAPDFVKTKQSLADAKIKLEEYKTNSKNFLTEEKIKSYLSDDTISEEAKAFYNDELAKITEDGKAVIEQLDATIADANTIIEKEEALIDCLVTNKNTWVIKDGAVAFDKEEKASEYNRILRELVAIFEKGEN